MNAAHHIGELLERSETTNGQKTLQDIVQRHSAGDLTDNLEDLVESRLDIWGDLSDRLKETLERGLKFLEYELSSFARLLRDGLAPDRIE